MPPIDPRLIPPQPQSFPGNPFPPPPSVTGVPTTIQQADTRLGLDREANQRAWQDQQREAERLQIAKDKAARDAAAAQANAGVETIASQDQAFGHVVMLRRYLKDLGDVQKRAPDSLKPTLKEVGVRWLFQNSPETQAEMAGFTQDEDRQVAAGAYRGALESAIWLTTGAAAPKEQVANIAASFTPLASDKPAALQAKKQRLIAYLQQAQARSGPAILKLNTIVDGKPAVIDYEAPPLTDEEKAGLNEFIQNADMLYGADQVTTGGDRVTSGAPDLRESQKALSGDTADVPLPPAMQEEHAAFLKGIKRGELTLPMYLQFRQGLAKKYNYPPDIDYQKAQEFVDALNEGKPTRVNIPTAERELHGLEKSFAGAAADEGLVGDTYAGLTGFVNAGAGGIPSLLAGQENRDAKEMMSEAHPKSSLFGEVTGSIVPTLALEAAASKGFTRLGADSASRLARGGADITGNTAYGGIKGFNEAGEGQGAEGAFNEAIWGAGGSVAGRGLTKGFKEAKPKEFREAIDMLAPQPIFDDAGKKIGMTPGVDATTLQRMGAGRGEEFFEGFPGVSGSRQGAVDSWNRQNTARVLSKVGLKLPRNIQPGQHANAYVHKVLGEEYDKIAPQIGGTLGKGDQWFEDVAAIRRDALNVPKGGKLDEGVQEMWQKLENATSLLNVNGKFDYDSYKKFAQEVREWQRFWAASKIGTDELPSPVQNAMARRAQELLRAGRELVSRKNPAAGARLKRIDEAWRHQMIYDIASLGAAKKNLGVASPEEVLNAIERTDFSKGRNLTSQGKAYQQPETNAALRVLGAKPARGGSLLGTAAIGFGSGGTAIPIATSLYAPGIKRLTQALSDGRIAATVDGKLPAAFVRKNPWAKELPSDVVKQIMASAIREKGSK